MRKRVAFGSGVVLLALLVTLVVWQGSFNLDQFGPSSIQQTYVFWAVSTLVFVLTVMLGFILFRTGVRLYIERQANRPGSHIKSKLIGGALALSVLPIFFLVLWSVSVLNRNLDSWFSRPARSMNVDLSQVGTALDQVVRDKLAAQAHWLASQSMAESADFYEQFCMANEIEHAEIESLRGVKRVLCSVPKTHDAALYTAQIKTASGVLTLSARMPLDLAAKQKEINGFVAEYNRLAVDRKAFRSLYLLLLSLITLFILFFAIWIARYMAGQISTPITALLKAAEQIRKGNLGYRVHVNAIDEMATLVKAFNEMTEALETNSKELEARRRFTEAILESIPTGVISLTSDGRIQRVNRALIAALASVRDVSLQVGGGVRTSFALEELLDAGVARVVIGSAAVERPAEVAAWLTRYGPERLCLAFDVRVGADGVARVQTRGWSQDSGVTLWEALGRYSTELRHVLCTDIARDGALSGPNLELYRAARERFPHLSWQASGGVRDAADLAALGATQVAATVCGKALVEERISCEELRPFLPDASSPASTSAKARS